MTRTKKGQEEKDAETTEFAKYKMFCTMTRTTEQIEQLKADIETAKADAAAAAKQITVLDADVATWEAEKAESDKARAQAHSDYMATHAEYEASIASVNKAVETLQAGSGTIAQSLIQLSARSIVPPHARRMIQSFLQRGSLTQARGKAPEANAFESSSGGVVDMVKGLGKKFKDELGDLEKAETEEDNNHQMLLQDLIDQIEDGKRESEKKKALKMRREQDGAAAEGDLADVTAGLGEDEKFLKDLNTECQIKAEEYEQNQVARAGEITAIKKAREIMSSDKVTGGKKSLVQQGDADDSAPVLVQLRSAGTARSRTAVVQGLAAGFLADRAKSTGSRVLSLISMKMQGDSFKKITKMIKDMITKLMEEGQEEAEHKAFCDTEMGMNKVTRDQKSEEVASLKADIEELTADVAKLTEEATDLAAAIADLDGAVSEATAIRTEEKTKNTATIEEAKVGGEAVAQALAVLKEYYEGASLLQQDPDTPTNYEQQAKAITRGDVSLVQAPYTGMASGGIMGMLEVIESDFVRLESETTADEQSAAKAYKKFKDESEMDKAVKSTDLKHKDKSRTEKDVKLNDAKKDMANSQEGLDAAMAYFEKLKPSCVDAGVSYEDRVARRKEEIESLKEALEILNEQ